MASPFENALYWAATGKELIMEGTENISPPNEHDLLVSARHLETSANGIEDSSYTRTANFLKLLAPRMAMFESMMK